MPVAQIYHILVMRCLSHGRGGKIYKYMKYEKLSNRQLSVLHILWEEKSARSVKEIVDQTKASFINSVLTEFIIDKMISKGLIIRTGQYGTSLHGQSSPVYLYSPKVSFAEYYFERFKNISSQNLYCLTEKILRSDNLNISMLQSLGEIIADRIGGEKKERHDMRLH